MPMLDFPTRYRPRNPNSYVSPAVLTPPDEGIPQAFDPSALTAQNQDIPPLAPPPDQIPKPDQLNDTQAGASLANAPPLNPDNGPKANYSGLKSSEVMPPPGSAPPDIPARPPIVPDIPNAAPPAAEFSPKPPSDLDNSIAANQKALDQKHAERPAPPSSNLAQRIGMAVLSMTKLAPAANQIIHPKWSEQERGYEGSLADLEKQQEELDTAATTGATVEGKEAQAQYRKAQAAATDLYKHQTDPHYNMVQIDPQQAKDYVPWMQPDAKGEFWVNSEVANTLSKPDKEPKPYIVPEGSTVVDSSGKVLFTAPPKTEKPTGDFERIHLPAYAKSLGKTVEQLTPQQVMKAEADYAQRGQDPASRDAALASRELANTMRQMQIGQMPTEADAKMYAQDVLAHRLSPDQFSQFRGRGNGALGTMIEREVKKANPEFDWEQAAAEYQLTKSPQFQNAVRYMDSVQSSIPLVVKRAQELGNSKIRFVNGLANMGRDQLNDPALAKFQTDALLVADEIAKILQGGGTGSGTSDAKLQQAASIIRQSDSPANIAAKMAEVQQLISYRRHSLTKGTYMESTEQPTQAGAVENWVRGADGKLVKQ